MSLSFSASISVEHLQYSAVASLYPPHLASCRQGPGERQLAGIGNLRCLPAALAYPGLSGPRPRRRDHRTS